MSSTSHGHAQNTGVHLSNTQLSESAPVAEAYDSESDNGGISETELELERLVFGDTVGFREGLKDFKLNGDDSAESDSLVEEQGLAALADADLFFTDLGDDSHHIPESKTEFKEHHDDTLISRKPAAWDDSDDERLHISLNSVPRLRKLREAESEDVVTGKEYSRRLRRQYELLNPRPDWAVHALEAPLRKKRKPSADDDFEHIPSEDDMDLDDQLPSTAPLRKLLLGTDSLVRQIDRGTRKKRKLRPEIVDVQRAKDVGEKQPSSISSLTFHPQYPLLLTSGPSSTLFLHHIIRSPPAPTSNPLLTSMHIRNNPLTTTAFHPSDDRIFLSSQKRHFFAWNLKSGQVERVNLSSSQAHEQRSVEHFKISPDGAHIAILGTAKRDGGIINILSATSMQWVAQARIESRHGIADFCWWENSKGICIAAKNGEVSEWSLQEQRALVRWIDEGAVGTTTLSLGGRHDYVKSEIGTDRWIAIGSTSGIVNIYDRRVWFNAPVSKGQGGGLPTHPKPTKTLNHLATPTSKLAFSHDGQLLAMSSKWKPDALKLVHLPSCTVFRNWPTSSTPLGRITCVAFAPGDLVGDDLHTLLAVANEQGKVRLWEIR